MGVALLLLFCWAATTAASLEAVLPPPNELPNWAATDDATDCVPVPTPLAPDPEVTDMPPTPPPPLPVTEVVPPTPTPDDAPYLHTCDLVGWLVSDRYPRDVEMDGGGGGGCDDVDDDDGSTVQISSGVGCWLIIHSFVHWG